MTPLRLMLTGAFGLLATATLLVGLSATALRDQRDAEATRQARHLADGLARRIGHALDAGVPLDALQGSDTVFRQQIDEVSEIEALVLIDRDGRVLQQSQRAAGTVALAATVGSIAPVVHQGVPVADLHVQRRPTGGLGLRASGLLPMALAILAALLLAGEFAQHAAAAGPQRRLGALARLARAVCQGRRDAIVVGVPTPTRDPALGELLAGLRGAHEERARLQRLVASLRATEPDRGRRERLDGLAARIDADERFAEAGLAELPDDEAGAADTALATALAACALSAGLTLLVRWVLPATPLSVFNVTALALLPALALALGLSLVHRRASAAARAPFRAGARGTLAGAAFGASLVAANLGGLGAAVGLALLALLPAAIARWRG